MQIRENINLTLMEQNIYQDFKTLQLGAGVWGNGCQEWLTVAAAVNESRARARIWTQGSGGNHILEFDRALPPKSLFILLSSSSIWLQFKRKLWVPRLSPRSHRCRRNEHIISKPGSPCRKNTLHVGATSQKQVN